MKDNLILRTHTGLLEGAARVDTLRLLRGRLILLAVICFFSAGCKTWDMPAYEDPVTLGSDGSSGRIAWNELASRGYVVTLITANSARSFHQESFEALVLGSPVYGAEIRPPIQEFISANAPFSVPVFAVLTGFGMTFYEEYDLPNLSKVLDRANVSLAAATKIGTGSSAREIEQRIASLCDAIDMALKKD